MGKMEENHSNDDTDHEISDSLEVSVLKSNSGLTQTRPFDKSIVSKSILNVLEEKNRFIAVLKKQIQDQKGQLQFYLHRGLNAPQIVELAKDCVSVDAEENIAVDLALTKFYNQSGLKSRLAGLYESMRGVETRVMKLIEDQENAVKKVFFSLTSEHLEKNKLCEVFGNILDATCILRSELEAFRTCSNRLIVIEDERNDLVEQVYSVPVSERINYNTLLATLHEKTRLEKEIIDIKQQQKQLFTRLNSLPEKDGSEQKAKDLQKQGKDEVNQLTEMNGVLVAKISALKQDIECKDIIENRMEKIIGEYQLFRENAAKQLTELHNKLGMVIEENDKLRDVLNHYKDVDGEVKCLRNKLTTLEDVQKQRDHYKMQFEQLQSIRNTYAQIVHKPFETLRDADKIIMQQKQQLINMDLQLNAKRTDIFNLNVVIERKNREISELRETIEAYKAANRKKKMVHDEVNTPLKKYKNVGINYNHPTPRPRSRSTNRDRIYIKQSEDRFVRFNDLHSKKTYSKVAPVTTLKVHSINGSGIVETLRAVVESTSPVDGIIQLTNNSAFTVRLSCGSQMESPNLTQPNANNATVNCTNLSNAFKCSTIGMDEFELMKDSSNDALVPRMPSCHSLTQAKIVEHQRMYWEENKCEDINLDSIYESETARDCSDVDNSNVDALDVEDDCISNSTGESFKDRIKRIVDNKLCRQVFDRLFNEEVKQK